MIKNMTKTKKTSKEIQDIQEKQFNRLKRKAKLGLAAYDNDDKVYKYASQEDKFKDEMIAVKCINNDKPVPPDVEHRLLAEKEARRKARNIEQEKFERTLPEYLRHRR